MPKTSTIKNITLGSIAALQTVLERYPNLLTNDQEAGNNACEFILHLLYMFGITEERIMEWLAELLAGMNTEKSDGILYVIEQAVKTIILASLKDAYTCSVNPALPDSIMYSPHENIGPYSNTDGPGQNGGIVVNICDIDAFGLLNYCPTDRAGSIFYFDADRDHGYTPTNVYSSTDFNAYLWFCINKGLFDSGKLNELLKLTWDNRGFYYKKFQKNECLIGDFEKSSNLKREFFDATKGVQNAPTTIVRGLGPKQEILICKFEENINFSDSGSTTQTSAKKNTNRIRVFANKDRYFRTLPLPNADDNEVTNKTIFEFNADYLASLRLFDTKTLIAQIVNAVLGIGEAYADMYSPEQAVMAKKVRSIVERVINEDEQEVAEISDCYYTFDNDEYDALMNEALLNYNGQYQSGNETNDLIDIPVDEIIDEIYSVSSAENLHEEITIITQIFKNITTAMTSGEETQERDKRTFGLSIIQSFIKETFVQIVMQILSPKVMLLYAINDKIMNPDGEEPASVLEFIRNFQNLIVTMIREINNIIIGELFNFLMGQIKPLITLFVQKLVLETMVYYEILIEQLIKTCVPEIDISRGRNEPLFIENVRGADIIPEKTDPIIQEC